MPYETWVHSEDMTRRSAYLSQCRWVGATHVYVHWRSVMCLHGGELVERSGGYVYEVGVSQRDDQ